YIAWLIHRTCGGHRARGARVEAQVRARRHLLLDRGIGANRLLRGGRDGRSGRENEDKRECESWAGQHGLSPLFRPRSICKNEYSKKRRRFPCNRGLVFTGQRYWFGHGKRPGDIPRY